MPLRDLLTQAMQRARVSTQVTAAQIVSFANESISSFLKPDQRRFARAISYKNQLLTIEVLRASVGQYLKEQERDLIKMIQKRFPMFGIQRIRFRVVHHFHTSEL